MIAGWVVGMAWGLYLLWTIPNPSTGRAHFGGSALALGKRRGLQADRQDNDGESSNRNAGHGLFPHRTIMRIFTVRKNGAVPMRGD